MAFAVPSGLDIGVPPGLGFAPPPGLALLAPPGLDVANASFPSFPDTAKLWKRQVSPADTCATAAPNLDDVADFDHHDEWCEEASAALAEESGALTAVPEDGESDDEEVVCRLRLNVRRLVMLHATPPPAGAATKASDVLPAQPLASSESDSESDDEEVVQRLRATVRRFPVGGAK